MLPRVAEFVTSRLVDRIVPFTVKSCVGAVVFIPTRLLLTSIYNKSVSKARSTPSRNRLLFSKGPEILPRAMIFHRF